MRLFVPSIRLAAALVPTLLVACTESADPPPPTTQAAPSTEEVLADVVEELQVQGNMRAYDGTPVATLSVHQTWTGNGLLDVDPTTVDPNDPATVPALHVAIAVEGYGAGGQLLFASDTATVGTKDYPADAPISASPLGSVPWHVRAADGTMVALDPANPEDAIVIDTYASTINEVLAYAVTTDDDQAPPPEVDGSGQPAPSIARTLAPKAYFEGCTDELATSNMFDAKCLLKLLSLLEQAKTCWQRISKAKTECNKPNNTADCLEAVGDVVLCLGKIGIDGYMFYEDCLKAKPEKGLLILPDNKLILPGDKEFVLPPPKK